MSMKMDGGGGVVGNQHSFTGECVNTDSTKMIFPQNSYNVVTSSGTILRHTTTDSTPPKITSTLTKVRIFIDFLFQVIAFEMTRSIAMQERAI